MTDVHDAAPQHHAEAGRDIDVHRIWVTIFDDERALKLQAYELTLPELADCIRTTSAAAKADLPLIKLQRFGDMRTRKKCLRSNANVTEIHGIEVEHDEGTMTFDEAAWIARESGLRMLLYTTSSYIPGKKERWRALVPLSQKHPPETHTGFVARLQGVFGGVLARECFTLSQPYYYGCINNNPDHRVEMLDGDFLNLRDDTYAGSIFKDGSRIGGQGSPGIDFNGAGPQHKSRKDDDPEPVDLLKIEAALNVIGSDCDYEKWLKVAAALRHALGESGFAPFDWWSAKATGQAADGTPRYTSEKAIERWRGARSMTDITIATLFHFADQADPGWRQRYEDAGQTTPGPSAPQAANPPPRQSLAEVHAVFNKWLGAEYDLDAATATMAAAASEHLPGDPLWLLLVAGPGGAKTETVQSLAGAGAYITSTISSEGALLSASPARQKSKKSTGGLLRKIGDHGTLVIKDFTSILSAARETRGMVLAAIREIYDGRWERNVGSDGGQTLTWTGRIVIVAAVTTAWDAAHAVVASMGDRFVLLRLRTKAGREAAGRGAIRNTGNEIAMRQELADAVGALIAHMDTTPYQLSEDEVEKILKAANLVTVARSAVERDYRGDIEFAHDPEAPTRFARQLVQLLRGAIAIGTEPAEAMRLVRRCACDSLPPLRRDILLDLAEHPGSRAADVRKRISQPRNTVRRGLECLHMLGTLTCEETEETGRDGKEHIVWRYMLAEDLDQETLLSVTAK